jgi:hypothetical protein
MVIIPRILIGIGALGSLVLALGLWLGVEQVHRRFAAFP